MLRGSARVLHAHEGRAHTTRTARSQDERLHVLCRVLLHGVRLLDSARGKSTLERLCGRNEGTETVKDACSA